MVSVMQWLGDNGEIVVELPRGEEGEEEEEGGDDDGGSGGGSSSTGKGKGKGKEKAKARRFTAVSRTVREACFGVTWP